MFKKPTKRKNTEVNSLDASTSKKTKPNENCDVHRGAQHQKTRKSRDFKNKSLLSFDDDEQ